MSKAPFATPTPAQIQSRVRQEIERGVDTLEAWIEQVTGILPQATPRTALSTLTLLVLREELSHAYDGAQAALGRAWEILDEPDTRARLKDHA